MSHSGRIPLPESEMTWRFSRSSGAGGQHVNTTDTRVELIWSLTGTTALTADQKELAAQRLRNRAGRRRDHGGVVAYRSQHRNREAARVRLEELVSQAVVPPKPRRATRRTRASVERRLDAKKRRSDVKKSRRGHWD